VPQHVGGNVQVVLHVPYATSSPGITVDMTWLGHVVGYCNGLSKKEALTDGNLAIFTLGLSERNLPFKTENVCCT
jgi:hypothetical protein